MAGPEPGDPVVGEPDCSVGGTGCPEPEVVEPELEDPDPELEGAAAEEVVEVGAPALAGVEPPEPVGFAENSGAFPKKAIMRLEVLAGSSTNTSAANTSGVAEAFGPESQAAVPR